MWVRWEVSRRFEVTLGIRLIILDRFVKALVLGLGGIVLLVVTETGGLRDFTHQL